MPPEERLPSRRGILAGAALTVISLPVLQNWSGSRRAGIALAAATDTAGGWTPTVKAADLAEGAFQTVKGYEWKFILARDGNKVYALSVACTHKNGRVKAYNSLHPALLICPNHGSRFDIAGAVVRRPATTSLARYAIRLSNDGIVEVDTSRKLTADEKEATLTLPDAK